MLFRSQGIEKDMVINFSEVRFRSRGARGRELMPANGQKEIVMVFNFRYDAPVAAGATEEAETGQTFTWLIRFLEQGSFDRMQEGVSTALFERKWGAGSWKKLKVCSFGWEGGRERN